jgi:MFS transporter, ACS family, hexuronate transporter
MDIKPAQTVGNYRWVVCALIFFATTINYIDRQIISLLKPTLETEFNWTETDYSRIVSAFVASYAVGYIIFGNIIDRIGSKMGYTISITFWSIAAMAHALVKSTFGFGAMRSLLGLGEGGNFPAAVKSVAEWFPKKERALATGIFNSGTSIGAVAAPILVYWMSDIYGWRQTFVITGAIGLVWLVLWLVFYEVPSRQKRLSKAEFDYIHSDTNTDDEAKNIKIPLMELLAIKQTWAFIVGKFFTDPVWWFFLAWLPSYFSSTFTLDLKTPGSQVAVVYGATTVGSILGGYISSKLIKTGWAPLKARKATMLIAALAVIPIIFARLATDVWAAVAIISLAAAAHQAWSANLFTIVSDTVPTKSVSSVVGVGGMMGAVSSTVFPLIVGFTLDHYKLMGNITTGYNLIFIFCGSAYIIAWLIITRLTSKLMIAGV